jgi:hypothetical protein
MTLLLAVEWVLQPRVGERLKKDDMGGVASGDKLALQL